MSGPMVIRSGAEAARDLGDPAFLRAWRDLAAECPWSTVFQSPSFVASWYETYAARYEPVLVEQYDERSALIGFLPLGRSVGQPTGLVVAGANQAEYHAWLCPAAEAGRFLGGALEALGPSFGSRALVFRYLPEGFPVALLGEEPLARARVDARAVPRPILDLTNPEAVGAPSKQTKNKLNRLRRYGEVRFERITDRDRFEAVLAEAMPLCDLRQGAVHDSMPFRQDARKEAFHRALFDRGDALHVTALFAGERVASVQINTYDGRAVYLGISAYSPFFAHASPGRLHIVLLLPLLAGEGFRRLDLTPGGDQYKERFAGSHDEVCELSVYPARLERDRARLRRRLVGITRTTLGKAGLRFSSQRRPRTEADADAGTLAVVHEVAQRGADYVYYSCAQEVPPAPPTSSPLALDGIRELLGHAYGLPRGARRSILSESLARLEGDELLLVTSDGRGGRYWAWFNPAPAEGGVGWAGKALSFPEGTGCLYDLGILAAPVSPEPPVEALRKLLAECKGLSGLADIYVVVPAGGGPLERAAEEAGLRRLGTLAKPRRAGSRHRGDESASSPS